MFLCTRAATSFQKKTPFFKKRGSHILFDSVILKVIPLPVMNRYSPQILLNEKSLSVCLQQFDSYYENRGKLTSVIRTRVRNVHVPSCLFMFISQRSDEIK